MRELILRFYLTVRKPRNFLKIVFTFIISSLLLHWFHGYDTDWGSTNLILSIDATIASTVMLMIQEESAEVQAATLKKLLEMSEQQDKTLRGVLLIAEAQRDMLQDHTSILVALKQTDEKLLKALVENRGGNDSLSSATNRLEERNPDGNDR